MDTYLIAISRLILLAWYISPCAKDAGCLLGDRPLSVEAGLQCPTAAGGGRGWAARSEYGRSDLGGSRDSSQGGKGLFSNHQGALLYSREPFTDIWSTPKWN